MNSLAVKKDEKYTLDHSIIVYLFGPDNQFLTYLGSNLDEQDMTDIILDEISSDLKRKILSPKKQQGIIWLSLVKLMLSIMVLNLFPI